MFGERENQTRTRLTEQTEFCLETQTSLNPRPQVFTFGIQTKTFDIGNGETDLKETTDLFSPSKGSLTMMFIMTMFIVKTKVE